MNRPARVLIVDDSAFMRKAISTMLADDPALQVIGQAANGEEGLRMARELSPDVITMDIEMPRMDGLTALRRIMDECPTHVLMLSSLTTEGSNAAMNALKLGAADVMAKDASQISFTIHEIKDDLVARLKALGTARKPRRRSAEEAARAVAQAPPTFKPGQFDLVCIGSSTGGPPVVEKILSSLPAGFGAAVVVAQHMPELFTQSMAQRLGQVCQMPVLHGSDGMTVQRNTITIAPGGRNTHIKREGLARWVIRINKEPAGTLYFPSVDVLLATAADAAPGRTLGIVLTGMGEDGLKGAKELKARSGVILAQNEETSVVYGMPRAVNVAQLTLAALPPEGIVQALATLTLRAGELNRKSA